ncbi:MAG: hybrid sensor histidine kinase/response regulator [Candidatus Kapaibacteriota bacterium]|jgi:two-component system sensor histidine kinase/response regulator
MEYTNHILIVDDVQENINLLGIMLQKRGFSVSTCTSGEAALAAVAERLPDLLLLDISMPEMDGFEVTRRLKNSAVTRDIPIVFLTAFTDKKRIVEGFELGGVDYITKPYNAAELFARIKTHLELKHTKDLLLQRNQELQIVNEKLHQLNLDKDELLGIVAHDLKSPLSAIRGIADALVYDETLPQQIRKEFEQTILSTSDRMFTLIAELLNANALERGAVTFEQQPIRLSEVLQIITEQYRKQAENKAITFQMDIEPAAIMFADQFALQQICDNFVSNALKYSPHGKSIMVRASLRHVAENGQEAHTIVRLEIQDQGPGLSEEDLTKLFGKFQRLSARPTAGEHSTGLGLSIVKKLADAMGANIGCHSTLGNGATFFLELPCATPEQIAEMSVSAD